MRGSRKGWKRWREGGQGEEESRETSKVNEKHNVFVVEKECLFQSVIFFVGGNFKKWHRNTFRGTMSLKFRPLPFFFLNLDKSKSDQYSKTQYKTTAN